MKDKQVYTQKDNQSLNKDLSTLFENISRLESVSVNPDGSRKGKYTGEAVLLIVGSNYYLEVCVGAGTTTWRGVALTNTP